MTTRVINIPLYPDPVYEQSVSLEGQSHILRFTYVDRLKLYLLDIYDSAKNPKLRGVGLVPSYPIIGDYALEDLTGIFYLIPKANTNSEAYKDHPSQIDQYYDLLYAYEA